MDALVKKVRFDCSPSNLYTLFADAQSLSEATGFRAKGDARAGTAFSAGGGALRGTTLYAERDRLIIQAWRASDWPKTAGDSILVLRFAASGTGTDLHVALSGLPEGALASAREALDGYYWTPIKQYLKALKTAANPPRPRGRPRKVPLEGKPSTAAKPRGRSRKSGTGEAAAPAKPRGRPVRSAAGAAAGPKTRGRPAGKTGGRRKA